MCRDIHNIYVRTHVFELVFLLVRQWNSIWESPMSLACTDFKVIFTLIFVVASQNLASPI